MQSFRACWKFGYADAIHPGNRAGGSFPGLCRFSLLFRQPPEKVGEGDCFIWFFMFPYGLLARHFSPLDTAAPCQVAKAIRESCSTGLFQWRIGNPTAFREEPVISSV